MALALGLALALALDLDLALALALGLALALALALDLDLALALAFGLALALALALGLALALALALGLALALAFGLALALAFGLALALALGLALALALTLGLALALALVLTEVFTLGFVRAIEEEALVLAFFGVVLVLFSWRFSFFSAIALSNIVLQSLTFKRARNITRSSPKRQARIKLMVFDFSLVCLKPGLLPEEQFYKINPNSSVFFFRWLRRGYSIRK